MTSQELIQDILAQPNAPQLVQQISEELAEEQRRRQQFYNDITETEKIEYINGEIVIHSPVKKEHNDSSRNAHNLISNYVAIHGLGYVGFEKIMVQFPRNDYEPDICFFRQEKATSFKTGQSLFPIPDMIVEVLSPKTAQRDRGVKFEDFQTNGVEEYWIIDPVKETVEQYLLNQDGQYELEAKAGNGTLTSQVISGFEIPVEAVFDQDANLAALKKLLQ